MNTSPTQPTNNHKTKQLVITGVIAVLAMIGIYAANDDDAPAGVPGAVVPDVVGMNHQAAQDTMQAAGFHVLREEDATGQGRMLVLDRNWEVVAQSAKAGTTLPTDTVVTLSSKKIDE